jgi:hypothetical protein
VTARPTGPPDGQSPAEMGWTGLDSWRSVDCDLTSNPSPGEWRRAPGPSTAHLLLLGGERWTVPGTRRPDPKQGVSGHPLPCCWPVSRRRPWPAVAGRSASSARRGRRTLPLLAGESGRGGPGAGAPVPGDRAAAVAQSRGSVGGVEPGCEQLAGRVVT